MLKTILVLIFSVSLIGCASNLPKEVNIPVATCVATDVPPKPDLPIEHLNPDSKPDVIIKAYVATVKLLMGHIDQLEVKLKATQCDRGN